MKVYRFHVAAEADLTEAAEYYLRVASPALAAAFATEIERSVSLICETPGIGSPNRGGTYVLSLRRFPYSVVYADRGSHLLILAVAHQRRRPGFWASRLKESP